MADCSRWSLQLRIWQWNALTSSRGSAFKGLVGLHSSLNYECGLGLCKIQHHIIRIGDDLSSRIIWQILHSIISTVKHPLILKKTWSALFCLPYTSPTYWKPRQRMCKGWIIHFTFSKLIEQLIHNSIDWKLCRECNNQINLCLLLSIYAMSENEQTKEWTNELTNEWIHQWIRGAFKNYLADFFR